MTVITRDTVVRILNELVDEFGEDYVYPVSESIHVLTEAEFQDSEYSQEQDDYATYLEEYGVCSYVNREGEPSCIVGHLIKRIDEGLFENLAVEDRKGEFSAVLINEKVTGINFEQAAVELIDDVQSFQDTGMAWGQAFARSV